MIPDTEQLTQSGLQLDVLEILTELADTVDTLAGQPRTSQVRQHIALTRKRVIQFWRE